MNNILNLIDNLDFTESLISELCREMQKYGCSLRGYAGQEEYWFFGKEYNTVDFFSKYPQYSDDWEYNDPNTVVVEVGIVNGRIMIQWCVKDIYHFNFGSYDFNIANERNKAIDLLCALLEHN